MHIFCYWYFLTTSILKTLYFLKWCPIFDDSLLHQFTKDNNFLIVYWFLGKNLSNFVYLPWKFNNRNNSNLYWTKISCWVWIVGLYLCRIHFTLLPFLCSVFKRSLQTTWTLLNIKLFSSKINFFSNFLLKKKNICAYIPIFESNHI